MSLRDVAHADIRAILSDEVFGAAVSVTIINPDNFSASITGYSNDISLAIDPDTGVPVSGRSVTFAVSMADFTEAGLGCPRGIADPGLKPWRVVWTDILGGQYTFKVSSSDPDRTLGIVMCNLEFYNGH